MHSARSEWPPGFDLTASRRRIDCRREGLLKPPASHHHLLRHASSAFAAARRLNLAHRFLQTTPQKVKRLVHSLRETIELQRQVARKMPRTNRLPERIVNGN